MKNIIPEFKELKGLCAKIISGAVTTVTSPIKVDEVRVRQGNSWIRILRERVPSFSGAGRVWKTLKGYPLFFLIFLWCQTLSGEVTVSGEVTASYALTLNEAIQLAKENLPGYKSRIYFRESQLYEYRSSLSPYFPTLDLSLSQKRLYLHPEDYNLRTVELRLSYPLYDGGKRYGQRLYQKSLLMTREEDLRQALIELSFNVKLSFYNALAKREVLKQRRAQLDYAQTNYEVAKARYEVGVARLSDVLQASVRLEEARYRVISAERDLKKALLELGSLIGRSVTEDELEGELSEPQALPDKSLLVERAFDSPEVKRGELQKELAVAERRIAKADFMPSIFLDASYTRNSSSIPRAYPDEEKVIGLRITFNIFEFGKFPRLKSKTSLIEARQEDIREIKRRIRLEIEKAYEDLLTELKGLEVAKEQMRFAEANYQQALGEYKVGKGDILSLIQAEEILSDARERVITSKFNILNALINLERISGTLSGDEVRVKRGL